MRDMSRVRFIALASRLLCGFDARVGPQHGAQEAPGDVGAEEDRFVVAAQPSPALAVGVVGKGVAATVAGDAQLQRLAWRYRGSSDHAGVITVAPFQEHLGLGANAAHAKEVPVRLVLERGEAGRGAGVCGYLQSRAGVEGQVLLSA